MSYARLRHACGHLPTLEAVPAMIGMTGAISRHRLVGV